MNQRKYSVASVGSRIDAFLQSTLRNGGFKVQYEILDVQAADGDFETPDVLVKFSGGDVDLLLSNRAELLLALEHVTMEMLQMPSEDHSRVSFDANDYRLLRIEELRLSAVTAAEKVKRTGVPFRFNPMNSRERRVIHLALRAETAVRSERQRLRTGAPGSGVPRRHGEPSRSPRTNRAARAAPAPDRDRGPAADRARGFAPGGSRPGHRR